MTATRLAVLDLPEGNAMRAPGEAPGMMALEIAMDEMAEKLGLDPIEFRIRNDTQVDPGKARAAVLAAPARRVPAHRAPSASAGASATRKPAQVRDGRWLVGMGVAAAFRNNLARRSRRRACGSTVAACVTVETDMTDIGTGSYTIIAQTAAEMMGVPLEKVVVRLGDSAFPGLVRLGRPMGRQQLDLRRLCGVHEAARGGGAEARLQLRPMRRSPTAWSASGDRSVPLAEAAGDGGLVGRGRASSTATSTRSISSRPSARTSSRSASMPPPARSACAACWPCARPAASSIPKSARSQVIGAMTMGVGAALMEELAVDKRHGFFVNHDLAGYEVPVHADIPHQDVIFLDETDPISSPMKAKGVGELGICGVGAAVANAIYNATGVRVRDYPITLDKLLDRLPPLPA